MTRILATAAILAALMSAAAPAEEAPKRGLRTPPTGKRPAKRAFLPSPGPGAEAPFDAGDLLRLSEVQLRGKYLEARMSLSVVRGPQTRTVDFLLWTKGADQAVVKVIEPERDRGTAHLRIGDDLWNYNPALERVVKVAPSMMKQSWMGADFSNGDLVRSMALWRRHTFRHLGDETIRLKEGDFRAAKIECTPKKEWSDGGKVLVWIDRDRAIQLRHEYYDSKGKLERTLVMTDVRTIGTHSLATRLRVELPGRPRDATVIEYKGLRFDHPIPDETFTPEFLRRRLDEEASSLPRL